MNRKKRKAEKMRLKKLGMETFIPSQDSLITSIYGVMTKSQLRKMTFTRMIQKKTSIENE